MYIWIYVLFFNDFSLFLMDNFMHRDHISDASVYPHVSRKQFSNMNNGVNDLEEISKNGHQVVNENNLIIVIYLAVRK